METKMSLDEVRQAEAELVDQITRVAAEYDGREFPPDALELFEAAKAELEKTREFAKNLESRQAYLDTLSKRDENNEPEPKYSFQTRKSNLPDNLTNVDEYRTRSTSIEGYEQLIRDGARKLVERTNAQHPGVKQEDWQGDVEKLVGTDREVALRTIYTQSPEYKRDWKNYIQSEGRNVGEYMQRTASLTNTSGGFAVPVELDTTLILTNAGVVNPIRNLARVRQTNVNTVEFINSSGIVAGFAAEATEASDNAPVLAQPTVNIEKAFAFVPMSIEIAEDWAGIQQDMAMCFADAKNQLESQKFLTGLGHASHEPVGLIGAAGATAVVSTASTAVFAVADLFTLDNALSPRYRNNPTTAIVGNRNTFQKVRQFASNGVNIWVQLGPNLPAELIGYNAVEWSNMVGTTTTSGSTILVAGDFNYFAIVDRVGMNVEFIPHLFGNSNRFPTGQRGLYAYWRTSSQVLSPTLQANSAFVSLKVT